MTHKLLPLIALLLTAPGCREPDSVILINLDCDPDASPSHSIQVMLSEPGPRQDTKIFPASPDGQSLHFPTSLALVIPRSHSGQLNLAFLALDAVSRTTAHATERMILGEGNQATISVHLSAGEDLCGNKIMDPGETCDDGNLFSFDGCSCDCQLESPSSVQQPDAGSPSHPDALAPVQLDALTEIQPDTVTPIQPDALPATHPDTSLPDNQPAMHCPTIPRMRSPVPTSKMPHQTPRSLPTSHTNSPTSSPASPPSDLHARPTPSAPADSATSGRPRQPAPPSSRLEPPA